MIAVSLLNQAVEALTVIVTKMEKSIERDALLVALTLYTGKKVSIDD